MSGVVHLDFETYSAVNLFNAGAYRYAEDTSTEVILLGWAVDDGPVRVFDRLDDPRLSELRERVAAGATLSAHNAQFERVIWANVLSRRLGWPLPKLKQWDCTAIRSAAAGYPRRLEAVAVALKLLVNKDPRGKKLIQLFCVPDKDGRRVMPAGRPEEWAAFSHYCAQDVVVEQELARRLPALHAIEQLAFLVDSDLNDRGFPIDVDTVRAATLVVDELDAELRKRGQALTDGIAPTQRDAILEWLRDEGASIDTLQAQEVRSLLLDPALPPHVREVLEVRLEAGKAGVKKLTAMLSSVCVDGRVHGGFMQYGANTGRWSGRLVQPHNFARGDPEGQDTFLEVIATGDAELVKILYDRPLAQLSGSMRGLIRAPRGKKFLVADYSAIEARGLAWAADEQEMLERYRRGDDVYVAQASEVFRVPADQVTDEQRRIGKNLVLGAGYQMSGRKFPEFCATQGVHVTQEFGQRAIDAYRASVPHIVKFWYDVELCAKSAIVKRSKQNLRQLNFTCDESALMIQLPSGRWLRYPDVALVADPRSGRPQITYGREFSGRWVREPTYGGKLVENIIQAIARDLMLNGMIEARRHSYPLVMTVHDELVAEVDEDDPRTGEDFAAVISAVPIWAPGLPLTAAGFECTRYRKG
jgi:DNA polymerase